MTAIRFWSRRNGSSRNTLPENEKSSVSLWRCADALSERCVGGVDCDSVWRNQKLRTAREAARESASYARGWRRERKKSGVDHCAVPSRDRFVGKTYWLRRRAWGEGTFAESREVTLSGTGKGVYASFSHGGELVLIFASVVFWFSLAAPSLAQNGNAQEMDRSIKPGDDFYRYANGGWLRTVAIPAGQELRHTRAFDGENQPAGARSDSRSGREPVRQGSVAQKVGDYYASFMDVDAIEAKGMAPLADEMAAISAITNKASLSAYLGTTLNTEVDGLTANADHVFGVLVNQSFTDSKHYVFHLLQGGLGMPDRDAYLDPRQKWPRCATQYQAHIAAILKLAGIPDAEARAARVLSLESGSRRPTRQTPMPLTSSSRTIRGSAPTSTSRRPAWTGTPISKRPASPGSRNLSSGSRRRSPACPPWSAARTSICGRTISGFT